MRKQVLGETGGSLYTSAPCSDYDRLVTPDSETPFPDLLEVKYSGDGASNSMTFTNNNLSGSVDNIPKSLYCTLPRKKTLQGRNSARYQSSDSQSPLLPSSRYGSSGGESCGSRESTRRLSDDSFRYPLPNINRVNQKSNSYLNLVSTTSGRHGSVQSKNLDSTPLLDVSGLESRLELNRESLLSPTNSTLANTYDYHAAQLERFLEEYRTLSKQLTKMKETCDTIRQNEGDGKSLSNSRFLDPLLHNNVVTPTSGSEDGNPKSILKKSPASLTPSSSSPASSGILDASSPLSSSYWSTRNAQKRFESGYYKS